MVNIKKLLFTIFLLLSITSICLANPAENRQLPFDTSPPGSDKKVIGIFLEAPITYVNNETVRKIVPEKTKAIFPISKFDILPLDTTAMAVRTYMEDNRMIVNQYYSQPLNRADIQKIGKELNCNYGLFITVHNSAPRASAGLLSVSFRTTVTTDVRLLNIETGKYLISKQIVKDGSSTAIYAGIPSFDRAYNEALSKALEELTIDISTL